MNLQLHWIDAFTRIAGRGNPAGVVPLDAWLDERTMQAIAFENGLSETAFFVQTGPARYHLRWFTPATEVKLCGHATVASAYVLFEILAVGANSVVFDSLSGPLPVRRTDEGRIELDFPATALKPATKPDGLDRALGARAADVLSAGDNLLCVVDSANQVAALRPDFSLLDAVKPRRFIVTAPGDSTCDFVSRFFAPGVGIPEDPVTGSTHCALAPYWAGKLGRASLFARQVSSRGGELWCSLDGSRVRIAGDAVRYLSGQILAGGL